jgi:DNA repair photolyase
MTGEAKSFKGRGAAANPGNRFESLRYEPDPDGPPDETSAPATRLFRDASRSVIATNDSPDVGFSASINPYRGCEHGCVYCYARPTHEYLGFSAGLEFETKLMVKEDAPELLRQELSSARWQPQVLGVSGVTDPYQPIERKLRLTRRCLEVLAEFRNPLAVVTKNRLVTRDADLLGDLARDQAAAVFVSVTTLDEELQRKMEPRASHPQARLAAIRELTAAGVPVGVMVAPIIPGLNDHELPEILGAVAAAGARYAGMTLLRLPYGVADLFTSWLERHYPERKEKVLGRVRSIRGGRLNDGRFVSRMKGDGPISEAIRRLFRLGCRRAGLAPGGPELSTAHFRRPGAQQASLF